MRRFILFVLLVALCVYGLYRYTETRAPLTVPPPFTPAPGPVISSSDVHLLQEMDQEYTRLVQSVVPSVVSIVATRRVEQEDEDPLQLFLDRHFGIAPRTGTTHSLGSGVIVSKEGHIITNQHVVADVDEVSIRLSNGQTAPAQIIGSDPVTDIAVLKVSGLNLTPLPFGDSDQVKVGQRVIAVGNPFGWDETVTQGIISAKGRSMEDSANDFFQTDAAINPGNSGGPLIDLRGQIIAINSSIYSGQGNGGWEGIGFAIPSNTVRRALDAIIRTGRVPHGYLGVEILNPDLAVRSGIADVDGACVLGVTPGSPADKAGILKQDIITSIAGHPVHNLNELRNQIAAVPTGSQVPIQLLRNGRPMTVTAGIQEQTANQTAGAQPAQPAPNQSNSAVDLLAGVQVTEIPPDHRQDLPPNAHGVMVSAVDGNSPAAGTLQQSDVIEQVDLIPIYSVPEYRQAVSSLTGNRVLLLICRGGQRSFELVTR
ncbi:MAG: trypsin-like peptidase domain-containing protein [Chthoniobacteraceae bacterium]|jgi:serine protease Do